MLVPVTQISSLHRSLLAARFVPILTNKLAASTANNADFFAKNRALNRPMSPYVHYQPQLTWLLSITHRATGLGLTFGMYGFGISQLFISSTPFAQQLATLNSIPGISLVKAGLIASFSFHMLNGIRHLRWDMGSGFDLKALYASGYLVIILTILMSLAIFMTAKSPSQTAESQSK